MDNDLRERLDNWFENGFASPLDRLAAELQKLGEELNQVQQSAQRIRERLAEKPSLKSSAEPLLNELGLQRERLAQSLVDKWIEFVQRGGRLNWTTLQAPHAANGAADAADSSMRRRPTPPPREANRPADAEQRALLRDLMLAVGEPRDLANDAGLIHEVEALEAATQLSEQERWRTLTRDLQRSWLSMMVARTRGLKERIPLPPGMWGRINQILIRYPVFAKSAAPGHVNGLQAAHKAEDGSWRADALAHWQDLVHELSEPAAQEEDSAGVASAVLKWEGTAVSPEDPGGPQSDNGPQVALGAQSRD
jgi:hypothetical protein